MTTVSFPGLGIGEFSINPVAISFELFGKPVEIRWYGAIICIGMILAVIYVCCRAKQAGIAIDHILDFALIIIPCGVVGARLYYVLMKLDSYHSIGEVFAIWNGGLAIYGGIIAGGLALLITARVKKLSLGHGRSCGHDRTAARQMGQLFQRRGTWRSDRYILPYGAF